MRILSPAGPLSAVLYPPSDPLVKSTEKSIRCPGCNGSGRGKSEVQRSRHVPGPSGEWRDGKTVTRTVLVDGECYICDGIGRIIELTEVYRSGGSPIKCGGCDGKGFKQQKTEHKEYFPSGKPAPARIETKDVSCGGCRGTGSVTPNVEEKVYVLAKPDRSARR